MYKMVIYKIQSKTNFKIYVGSAINFNKRASNHLSDLKKNKHGNSKLQNHVNKYGIEDLEFSILEEVTDVSILIEREQFFIDTLKPEFNICKIAGSALGRKTSDETKSKQRLLKIGKKHSAEHVQKIIEKTRGKKRSPEYLEKMSKIRTGNFLATDETKKKLSDSHKGQIPWNKGFSMSIETKNKLSAAMKGRGHSQTEETKIKISQSHKKRLAK